MTRARGAAAFFLSVGLVAATLSLTGTAHGAGAASEWSVQPGIHQVGVLGAEPGDTLRLVGADDADFATGTVDLLGSLLFRAVPEGTFTVAGDTTASTPVDVLSPDDVPDPALYEDQSLEPGFDYITTRDGTTLSALVLLPGDPADGPYPTLVEYSGYGPSNPDSTGFPQLIQALGYAYVGVNMRGSGCSGGSYSFFDKPQLYDGYDVIETVAAQPWAQDHRVGMAGVSYPGISQLFVAQTQPPSLEAITPLSVIDDSYRAVMYPGGILNTGFGVNWLQQRMAENAFRGQPWTVDRIEAGDEVCAANQNMRLQNPDLVAAIRDADFYDPAQYDPVSPRLFVDRIEVPVLLAGAWQDEQTGGHFATMLEDFTGTDHFYATLTNGLHTESIGAGAFPRFVEFLDLYVGHRVPSMATARGIVPLLAQSVFGTDQISLPDDRFADMTYDDALAAFESEPPIQLLLEEGAADGALPGTPEPRFTAHVASWPAPENVVTTWYLGDGTLTPDAPTAVAGEPGTSVEYAADPSALPDTFYDSSVEGNGNVWAYDVLWDWRQPPPGTAASFVSEPFTADTLLAGSGSADLWIRSDAADTDLEVVVSEIRPDGQEVFVQGGWLRASQRALDESASTDLRPVQTHAESDAAPLPGGEWTPVRVEIFPFAHPMRAGSRLRVTVHAPGNNRPEWVFETLSSGERVEIAFDADHPSAIVLGQIDPAAIGIAFPTDLPTCTLRGQPCRPAPTD